ncbi:sugar-phosphate kinase [Lonepinella koalarum]|uniref:Tagatose-1,6-bisphosphate aldolase non-catalytic subunit AgaZ/GatZ n=1 Tax=Lonepinella koalarum TaxID=53417 RepID=A0A4R1KX39_9PAST|nr:class II D-tagatose-bisphosphate aldolase, non-catalytic subunit [Lonepinella koalarum]MDH2927720.1 sugar-phosphate kinase [Lonepinella koalarum]TCK69915.1 tagatose-1,6-bisphosphate aldolase non-catalytic subunit AgaZ/GatZ [Lonepinella koalarum]TFJ90481.1 sugar-phosphate kinase [Lonepinella koalarum]TYG35177.1 sugar-phosphate kinase [Lonepinella koalarum]
MKKLPIKTVVESLLKLQQTGDSATLLGIGPMSKNCVQAALELSKEYDYPVMFIASRNQVDLDELGGGYVNGWNQFSFAKAVKDVADEIQYDNLYYLCRDHGGPWQRDKERNDHLPVDQAIALGQQSYIGDIEAGFDLLMIDPTKDPFEVGKVIPLDTVLERTVELIDFCEKARKQRGIGEIGYEVGTEETNGGLTSTETYEEFILRLQKELTARQLPMPTFIVGQTGTLVRKTEQVGSFNFDNAYNLAKMAKKYNVGLKEHNGDYLDDKSLLEHIPSQITATNVAPQYGSVETRAYLNLAEVEQKLVQQGLIKQPSNTRQVLLEEAVRCERWRKWMIGDQTKLTLAEIADNPDIAEEILDIAGHYNYNNDRVKGEIEQLYQNLAEHHIDGKRYVIDFLKRPMRDYVECYNLTGVTSRIKALLS